MTDVHGKVLRFNTAAYRLHGSDTRDLQALFQPSREPVARWRMEDLNGRELPPSRWPTVLALDGRLLRPVVARVRHRASGREYVGSFMAYAMRDAWGEPGFSLLFTIQDNTARVERERDRERRLGELTAMVEVLQDLPRAGGVREVLQAALDGVGLLTGARTALAEHGWLDGEFAARAGRGLLSGEPDGQLRAEMNRLFARLIVRSAVRVARGEVAEVEEEPAGGGRAAIHPVLGRGLLAARLTDAEGKAVGWLLAADAEEGREFDAHDEAVLLQLAQAVSLSLQAATAEERVRKQRDRLAELNRALESQLEERSRRSRQLHSLAVQLAEAEERERRRIASLLHDELQQILVSARFQLQGLSTRLPEREETGLGQGLERIDRLLDLSIGASRRLSRELSPAALYQFGLEAAVRTMAAHMGEEHGLETEVRVEGWWDPGEGPALILYRSIQELLLNAAKHARASRAGVRMRGEEDGLAVEVSDDGVGFDLATAGQAGNGQTGFGLLAIRERLSAVGGAMRIESAPGRGSLIALSLPALRTPSAAPPEMDSPAVRTAGDVPVPAAGSPADVIRVLFADDHPIVRQGLVTALSGLPDIRVVGEAADGKAALELARELRPDVVVMDISMPVMDGIEATRRIRAECPGVRVIGLSMHDEEGAEAILRVGAETFVSKADGSGSLLRAIYRLAPG